MKLVGAALDGHVHGGSAGHTLLGVEAVGDYVHDLGGVGGPDISAPLPQPRTAHHTALTSPTLVPRRSHLDIASTFPASTGMPSRTHTENATLRMVTLYVPVCRSLNEYAPRSSVTTERATPVSILRASTVAPGAAASVESVTLPVRVP